MRLIYLALIATMLTGCGGEEFEDLREFIKTSGDGMRGNVPPPPNVTLYEPFAYVNEENISDPFKPRIPKQGQFDKRGEYEPDRDRPKEALEDFALESLRMVGFVHKSSANFAVIRAPNGKLYTVSTGNYMGLNFGLIKSISNAEITVKEVIQDGNGDWSERISSLQLVEGLGSK